MITDIAYVAYVNLKTGYILSVYWKCYNAEGAWDCPCQFPTQIPGQSLTAGPVMYTVITRGN